MKIRISDKLTGETVVIYDRVQDVTGTTIYFLDGDIYEMPELMTEWAWEII